MACLKYVVLCRAERLDLPPDVASKLHQFSDRRLPGGQGLWQGLRQLHDNSAAVRQLHGDAGVAWRPELFQFQDRGEHSAVLPAFSRRGLRDSAAVESDA